MSNTHMLAGMIARVDEPFALTRSGATGPSPAVLFTSAEEEHSLRLPLEAPHFTRWAIYAMQRMRRPVYLTVTGTDIVDVRVPIVGRVVSFDTQDDGSLQIAIDSSPRLLVLPPADQHERLRALLEDAWKYQGIVMVDADVKGEVVNADPAPWQAWHLAPVFDAPGAEPFEKIKLAAIDSEKLPSIFDVVAERACDVAPPSSCIPFDFPDTGCNARAHKIGAVLADEQIASAKVWIFDSRIRIATRNFMGGCTIGWFYHVAPYVRVNGDGVASVRVLDPALFPSGPVTFSEFVGGLHSVATHARFSRQQIYQLGQTGGSLEQPGQCDRDLEWLREEAAKRNPQPPYC